MEENGQEVGELSGNRFLAMLHVNHISVSDRLGFRSFTFQYFVRWPWRR